MKSEAIKLVSNSIKSAVAPKAEKVIAVSKDGEKAMAVAQDAMAAQGKAMVKKAYVKPQTLTVEIKHQELMAASGNGGNTHWTDDGGGTGGRPDDGSGWVKSHSIWDEGSEW